MEVDVHALVKKSSYTRGWLADYNALRKEETFAEGVFLTSASGKGGRVIFSLDELPPGDTWLTANRTPLERASASEVKIGDHVVVSQYHVAWQRLDPLELEIRPVRRRIDRINTELRPALQETYDDLISTTFIDQDDQALRRVKRSLARIYEECTRETKELDDQLSRIEKGNAADGGVKDTAINAANTKKAAEAALVALDRANAAVKLRAEVAVSRSEARSVHAAFVARYSEFSKRQVVIDKPQWVGEPVLVAEEVSKRVNMVLEEYGDNEWIGLHVRKDPKGEGVVDGGRGQDRAQDGRRVEDLSKDRGQPEEEKAVSKAAKVTEAVSPRPMTEAPKAPSKSSSSSSSSSKKSKKKSKSHRHKEKKEKK